MAERARRARRPAPAGGARRAGGAPPPRRAFAAMRSAFRRKVAQRDTAQLAEGRGAEAGDVCVRGAAHTGAPRRATCVAYDPTQRLLAVGAHDGVVKLFGDAQKGVDARLLAGSAEPVRKLAFARHSALLAGAVGARRLDVWELCSLQRHASIELDADIVSLAGAPGKPYFYAGCVDGTLRVVEARGGAVMATGAAGTAGGGGANTGARAAGQPKPPAVRLLPYCVTHAEATGAGKSSGDEVEGDGFGGRRALVAIRPQPGAEARRLLLAFADCSLISWDLPARRPQAAAEVPPPPEAMIAGARSGDQDALDRLAALARTLHLTDADWVPNGTAGLAVAGYSAGDVWLWSMADAMAPVLAEPTPATPLRRVPLHAGAVPRHCAPVVAVRAAGASRADVAWLYCLGGQPEDEMEAITAVPIALGDHVAADGGCASPPPPAVASAASGSPSPPASPAPVRTLLPPALPPPHRLVWFGHVNDFEVVSEPGPGPGGLPACAAVSSIITLTEGGQLHVHDEGPTTALPEAKPALDPVLEPLTPGQREAVAALREDDTDSEGPEHAAAAVEPEIPVPLLPALASPVTALAMCHCDGTQGGCGLSVEALADAGEFQGLPCPELPSGGAWPVTGGALTPQPSVAAAVVASRLLITGHRDGTLNFWDANGRVIACSPNTADVGMDDLAAVTCLQLCPVSGILVVGYQDGAVRVFVYSDDARLFTRVHIGANDVAGERPAAYKEDEDEVTAMPGFQYVASISAHKRAVRCAAVGGAAGIVATGDDANLLAVTDLAAGRILFRSQCGTQGLASLRLAPQPACAATPKSPIGDGDDASPHDPAAAASDRLHNLVDEERRALAVYALAADGTAFCIGVEEEGKNLIGTITPKASGVGRTLEVLDADGRAMAARAAVPSLPWMGADGAAGATPRPEATDEATADPAFVVVVSHNTARLYAAKEMTGIADKGSALFKCAAEEGEVWEWAGAVCPPESLSLSAGGAIVARSKAGMLKLISMPGMRPLGASSFADAVGLCELNGHGDPAPMDATCLDATTGALALATPEDGVHVLEIFAAAPDLNGKRAFDPQLAQAGMAGEAAAATAIAQAAQAAQGRASEAASEKHAQEMAAAAAAKAKRGLFGRIKDKMSAGAAAASTSRAYPPPAAVVAGDLADVLGATALDEAEAKKLQKRIDAARAEASAQAKAKAAEASARRELFDAQERERRANPRGGQNKSADEIREAYGRPRINKEVRARPRDQMRGACEHRGALQMQAQHDCRKLCDAHHLRRDKPWRCPH